MKPIYDFLTSAAQFTRAITPGQPEFFSPNVVAYETEILKLRFFGRETGTPILIVPPQAGHHSSIADYDNGQSLVQTCLENTYQPVFCIEWKSATPLLADISIEDLIMELGLVITATQSRSVQLIGLCQGGWLSTIFAALYPESVERLTIAGAPIDFHAGDGKLKRIVENTPQSVYEMMVTAGGGVMSGYLILAGWKMMNFWDRFITDYMSLWNVTGDDEAIRKIERFRTWYEFTQHIAGAWYLRAVNDLFRENLLVKGEFIINGDAVNLAEITCPVDVIVGGSDDITLPRHCTALFDHVSTPKNQQTLSFIPNSGHIGLFMGSKSQRYWAEVLINANTIRRKAI